MAHLINAWWMYTGRKDTHLLTRKETQEDVGRGYLRGEGTRMQAGKKTFFHSMPLYVKLSHVQPEI